MNPTLEESTQETPIIKTYTITACEVKSQVTIFIIIIYVLYVCVCLFVCLCVRFNDKYRSKFSIGSVSKGSVSKGVSYWRMFPLGVK